MVCLERHLGGLIEPMPSPRLTMHWIASRCSAELGATAVGCSTAAAEGCSISWNATPSGSLKFRMRRTPHWDPKPHSSMPPIKNRILLRPARPLEDFIRRVEIVNFYCTTYDADVVGFGIGCRQVRRLDPL
jgi:hypothetical protein